MMTPDEMIAVIQADKEGKLIEFSKKGSDKWVLCPWRDYNFEKYNYRIKPEPRYRPFKSAEEVREAIKAHGGLLNCKSGRYALIVEFDNDRVWYGGDGDSIFYEDAVDAFAFADGATFGVKEE